MNEYSTTNNSQEHADRLANLYRQYQELKAQDPGRAADYFFLVVSELLRYATPHTMAAAGDAFERAGAIWPEWPPVLETPTHIIEIG